MAVVGGGLMSDLWMEQTLSQLIRGLHRPLRVQRHSMLLNIKACLHVLSCQIISLKPYKRVTDCSENVWHFFGCRHPELRPPDVAGTAHVKRWPDGSVSRRHGALYAQFQLQYWHGVSSGSVWAVHYYGEFQWFTKLEQGNHFYLFRFKDAQLSVKIDFIHLFKKKKKVMY